MKQIWIGNLQGEDKERRKQEVLSYRNAFDSLREILEKDMPKEVPADYTNPAWAFEQAHLNGKREAYRKILELITLEKG